MNLKIYLIIIKLSFIRSKLKAENFSLTAAAYNAALPPQFHLYFEMIGDLIVFPYRAYQTINSKQ